MAAAIGGVDATVARPCPTRLLWVLRRPFAVYLPIAVAAIALSLARGLGLGALPVLLPAGFLLWTLIEYGIHRFVLHATLRRALRRVVAGRHLLHHRSPITHSGVVTLPFSALVGAVVLTALLLVLGGIRGPAVMAGVIAGYLVYEYVHLAIHLGATLPSRWGDWIRAHHLHHHARDASANFAIVLPSWDRVFGTLPRSRAR